jgi:hypothetical protein
MFLTREGKIQFISHPGAWVSGAWGRGGVTKGQCAVSDNVQPCQILNLNKLFLTSRECSSMVSMLQHRYSLQGVPRSSAKTSR